MRHIYQCATKVLVFDASLMQVSARRPAKELVLSFTSCGWMRRLWTLQEGMISQNCCLQFRDGSRTTTELHEMLANEMHAHDSMGWNAALLACMVRFFPFVRPGIPSEHWNLAMVTHLVDRRITSVRGDEPVILANILGLDVREILSEKEDDTDYRMVAFYRTMCSIPLNIMTAGPPWMAQCGWRWAPPSLLSCFRGHTVRMYTRLIREGYIGPDYEGLSCRMPGVFLLGYGSGPPLDQKFVVSTGSSQKHLYQCTAQHTHFVEMHQSFRHVVLLLGRFDFENAPPDLTFHLANADLGDMTSYGEGRIRCDFIGKAWGKRLEAPMRGVGPVFDVRPSRINQEWLIM